MMSADDAYYNMRGMKDNSFQGTLPTQCWPNHVDDIFPKLRITEVFHKPNENYPDPSLREEVTLKDFEVPPFLKEFLEKKKIE